MCLDHRCPPPPSPPTSLANPKQPPHANHTTHTPQTFNNYFHLDNMSATSSSSSNSQQDSTPNEAKSASVGFGDNFQGLESIIKIDADAPVGKQVKFLCYSDKHDGKDYPKGKKFERWDNYPIISKEGKEKKKASLSGCYYGETLKQDAIPPPGENAPTHELLKSFVEQVLKYQAAYKLWRENGSVKGEAPPLINFFTGVPRKDFVQDFLPSPLGQNWQNEFKDDEFKLKLCNAFPQDGMSGSDPCCLNVRAKGLAAIVHTAMSYEFLNIKSIDDIQALINEAEGDIQDDGPCPQRQLYENYIRAKFKLMLHTEYQSTQAAAKILCYSRSHRAPQEAKDLIEKIINLNESIRILCQHSTPSKKWRKNLADDCAEKERLFSKLRAILKNHPQIAEKYNINIDDMEDDINEYNNREQEQATTTALRQRSADWSDFSDDEGEGGEAKAVVLGDGVRVLTSDPDDENCVVGGTAQARKVNLYRLLHDHKGWFTELKSKSPALAKKFARLKSQDKTQRKDNAKQFIKREPRTIQIWRNGRQGQGIVQALAQTYEAGAKRAAEKATSSPKKKKRKMTKARKTTEKITITKPAEQLEAEAAALEAKLLKLKAQAEEEEFDSSEEENESDE